MSRSDRFFNPNDGTYANVPIIPVHPEIYRGKRFYGTDVLIGNWYEDRTKFKESKHRPKPFYRLNYPAHAGSVPDIVLRRKCIGSKEKRPGRLIVDHHEIDHQKQMISSYDEQYNRRGAYGDHQETIERKWVLQDDVWLPERSDHPLQSSPTTWGLVKKKRSQSECLRRQRTMPEISEYSDRFVRHRPETYLSSKLIGIPRIHDNTTFSNRTISHFDPRPIQMADPMQIDHVWSVRQNTNVPRALFYLGSLSNETCRKTEQLSCVTETINPIERESTTIEQTV